MAASYNDVLGWIGDETTRVFDIAVQNAPVSGAVFVEAGTYRGKSSICLYDKIVESGKEVTLYTIDNWSLVLPHDQPGDINKDIFIENKEARTINLIEEDSVIACDLFQSESIDFLFIDNNVQSNSLLAELQKWYPKVKTNGIISGHDYNWVGIKTIVDELFPSASVLEETTERVAEFDYQPSVFRLSSWYVIKE